MIGTGDGYLDGARVWAEEHFGELALGDARLSARVVRIAEALALSPGASIPRLFADKADVKGAYRLLAHPCATPDRLQAAHRERTREWLEQPGVWLLLEDGSDLSWSGSLPIPGLGPIGSGARGLQGFQLHSVLAVRWATQARGPGLRRPPVELLGLVDQLYTVRTPRPVDEHGRKSRQLARARESQLWTQAGERIGPAPDRCDVRWVRVCDRGADIYEVMRQCAELGHGYRIRAAQDRAVLDAEGRSAGLLFAAVRAEPAVAHVELEVRARPSARARVARLSVSARPVRIRSPYRPGHAIGSMAPIACTALRVWEAEPPRGVEPLEWIVLVDEPLASPHGVLEWAQQYATRWVIEEYHKAIKSRLGAERLQLESAARLFAAISIKSVVAMRVMDLKERVRTIPDAPAEQSGLSDEELTVLRARAGKPIATVRDVALAIGRMGGHLNRKGDGLPGTQTLTYGMERLLLIVEGVRLASQLKRSG